MRPWLRERAAGIRHHPEFNSPICPHESIDSRALPTGALRQTCNDCGLVCDTEGRLMALVHVQNPRETLYMESLCGQGVTTTGPACERQWANCPTCIAIYDRQFGQKDHGSVPLSEITVYHSDPLPPPLMDLSKGFSVVALNRWPPEVDDHVQVQTYPQHPSAN